MRIYSSLLRGFLVTVMAIGPSLAFAATKPFKALYTGNFTMQFAPDGSGAVLDFTGTGHATQLGHSDVTGHSVLVFNQNGCLQPVADFVLTTGANGDTITLTNQGQDCLTSQTHIHGSGTYTITGGTGRFLGASGTGTWVVDADITGGDPSIGFFTGDFTLSFSGDVNTL
jgi:hypothetical protein